MNTKKFREFAANENHPHWQMLISRRSPLYSRPDDIRTPFTRDYTRILHSTAYRRLKHKTQVFFDIDHDHVCTRMEHVAHVESVSSTIAQSLGLNEELTRAIAMGHDLGHAPFGHQGEKILAELTDKHLGESFWHEQNGLRFVDHLELLEDSYMVSQNLNLTYAVRDGILSHCGEVDENGLRPRNIGIPLEDFKKPGQYQAVTWEGCIVKLADKIAYVGRDIEDAMSLGLLSGEAREQLLALARTEDGKALNTTVIMHNLILDICRTSTPDRGICLSEEYSRQLSEVKAFNIKNIYRHPRLEPFNHYSRLVLTQLFETLLSFYDGRNTFGRIEMQAHWFPKLAEGFLQWLCRYCDPAVVPEAYVHIVRSCKNEKLYGALEDRQQYIRAVIDYISGMTDRYAITLFNELLRY